MLAEKEDLHERLGKLESFMLSSNPIYTGLSDSEKDRMQRQLAAMSAYDTVLGERIAGALGERVGVTRPDSVTRAMNALSEATMDVTDPRWWRHCRALWDYVRELEARLSARKHGECGECGRDNSEHGCRCTAEPAPSTVEAMLYGYGPEDG
jgi:hypothetical protein